MPSPKFKHLAPYISDELLAVLTERRARDQLPSLTAAARAILTERLEAGGPFGRVIAPPSAGHRVEMYLPVDLVSRVRELALDADAKPNDMLVTILASGAPAPLRQRASPERPRHAVAAEDRQPEPAKQRQAAR